MSGVLNIAHRGARSLAPENTLAAARKALQVDADMWELDVAVTADEALIVFHDDSLARTTDAATRFPDRAPWTFTTFTLAELGSLDAGSWFVETDPFGEIAAGAVTPAEQAAYRGEPIPTLQQALTFTKDQNYGVNVELKRLPPPLERFPIVERVLALIDALDVADHLVISSFVHDWLREIQVRRPQIEVQALIGYSETQPLDWGNLEFKTYNARHTLVSEARIRELRERGIGVNLWTIDDVDDMRRYIAASATGLINDYPHHLARLLREEKND